MFEPLHKQMLVALEEAKKAYDKDEVPIGAVIIDKNNQLITKAHNLAYTHKDPTAHAEILAIRQACGILQHNFLHDYTLISTCEPCAMCAMAASHARIGTIIFGAYDPKSGGIEQGAAIFNHVQTHHKPHIIGGVLEEKAQKLLRSFFAGHRI